MKTRLKKNEKSCKYLLTFAEASQAPDTNVLISGAKERLITSPVWPPKEVIWFPVSIFHNALGEERKKNI